MNGWSTGAWAGFAAFLAVLVGGIVLGAIAMAQHGNGGEGARSILAERFARGELSTEEYTARLHALGPARASRRGALLTLGGVLAVVGLIGSLTLVASRGMNSSGGMMGGGMGGMMGGGTSRACAGGSSASAEAPRIAGFAFCPATARVTAGTTVTWRNEDSVDHTVTAEGGKTFNSGNMSPGDSWSFTFERAGTYRYICAVHPWMKGAVQVT